MKVFLVVITLLTAAHVFADDFEEQGPGLATPEQTALANQPKVTYTTPEINGRVTGLPSGETGFTLQVHLFEYSMGPDYLWMSVPIRADGTFTMIPTRFEQDLDPTFDMIEVEGELYKDGNRISNVIETEFRPAGDMLDIPGSADKMRAFLNDSFHRYFSTISAVPPRNHFGG